MCVCVCVFVCVCVCVWKRLYEFLGKHTYTQIFDELLEMLQPAN